MGSKKPSKRGYRPKNFQPKAREVVLASAAPSPSLALHFGASDRSLWILGIGLILSLGISASLALRDSDTPLEPTFRSAIEIKAPRKLESQSSNGGEVAVREPQMKPQMKPGMKMEESSPYIEPHLNDDTVLISEEPAVEQVEGGPFFEEAEAGRSEDELQVSSAPESMGEGHVPEFESPLESEEEIHSQPAVDETEAGSSDLSE